MNLKEFDIISIEEFELNWRWTDPDYCQMPDDDLNNIKPLSIESANVVGEKAISFLEPKSCLISSNFFENIDSTEINKSSSKIVNWLQSRLKGSSIFISWDKDTAIITNVELFIRYWDDFCYPSSDNVTIWPLDESWVLSYCHFEQFWYGRSKLVTKA